MSGFGGFGTGSTGGGLFGAKPPEQTTGGLTLPATTTIATTSTLTFGTPTFGSGGTGGLLSGQQQTPVFGTAVGTKPVATTTAATGTMGFTFGTSTASTNIPTFGIPTTNTNLSTFGSFGTSTTSTSGANSLGLGAPKTTATTGFVNPNTSTPASASATVNFGLTPAATTSAPLTFGAPTISVANAPTASLTFNASAPGSQSTGFTPNQPTTTSSLSFGVSKATGSLTFGTAATTSTPTFNLGTSATTTPGLGVGLFGTPQTTESISVTTSTTTTSVGLGGIDNTQTTQGLSGSGTLEPKQAKDHLLPDTILQTLNEFQNFTKQQKSISVEISHGSSKPLKKVQEDTEAIESLLTMITSGLARNAIAVDKLKTETAQGLHQAEVAQRNHEALPELEYENSAPADYFNDLVTKFETDTVRLRVQIEVSEKHLKSLTQSSTISPQELTLAMRRLHETLIVLAARVQALHTTVQSQKEQYKNLRRVYFKDDINIFENETDQNIVKKQTIYSLRSLTGPTPFSETQGGGTSLHVDGLAMLAGSAGSSIPATSNSSWMSPLQGTANTPSIIPTSNLLGTFQPLEIPGFQLSKPPTGNKRSRR